MSVREGYKQTEIGVIPEEWEAVKLSDILTVKYGKNQKAVEDKNGQYPILGTGGIMGYAREYLWDKPSVLIGRKGTIDKPQYMDTPFWTVDTLFYTDIKDIALPKYVYYKFLTVDWRRLNEASGVPSLSAPNIHNVKMPLPPLPEQQKIAAILTSVDSKIAVIDAQIAKTEQLKKGLMQKLLSEGIGHTAFKESEIGRIPEGWEVVKQGEVATFYNGRAYKLSEWETEGTPVIRLQNLTGSGKEYYYSTLKLPEHQYVHNGDLIYMWSATFGVYIWKGEKAIYHYHIWKIECNDNLDKKYMYYSLDRLTEQHKQKSHGATMLHITKGGMEKTLMALPPLAEQKQIATILSTADDKLDILREKKSRYEKLKKGLMQKLLTGEVRVKITK